MNWSIEREGEHRSGAAAQLGGEHVYSSFQPGLMQQVAVQLINWRTTVVTHLCTDRQKIAEAAVVNVLGRL